MKLSLPQTKVDPLHRPKGCINSYKSVVNTAKNGLLVRSRIREIVLCCGIVIGFHKKIQRRAGWCLQTKRKHSKVYVPVC